MKKKYFLTIMLICSLFFMLTYSVNAKKATAKKELSVGRIVITFNDDLQQLHNGYMDQLEKKYKLNWPKKLFHQKYSFEKGMDEIRKVTDNLTKADPLFYNADLRGPPDFPDFEKRIIAKAKEMIKKGVNIIYCEGTSEQVFKATKGTNVIVIDGSHYPSDAAIEKGLFVKKADGKIYCTGNSTGTMLYYPVDVICEFVSSIKPGATIAYFYNDKSFVSRSPKDIEAAAKTNGLKVKNYIFYTPDDISKNLALAKKETDFAFFTNDLFVIGGHENAIGFSNKKDYPIITAIVPLVNAGVLAGMQVDWYDCGSMSADKTVKVIKGKKASDIPIDVSTKCNIGLNLSVANKLKYEIAYDWIELASIVVE